MNPATTTITENSTMHASTAAERRNPDPPEPGSGYEPPRLKLLLAALVVCLAAVGLILLFGGDGGEPTKPASAQDLPFIDGTLLVAEETRLVLRPADGAEVTFTIRPEDVENFDIAHLQSHSSVGIPTRIYYEEDGGTRYAVYKEDAPVNSQR